MASNNYVTIFSEKFDKLRADIKRLKKEKASKEKILKIAKEAKALRKILKEMKAETFSEHLIKVTLSSKTVVSDDGLKITEIQVMDDDTIHIWLKVPKTSPK